MFAVASNGLGLVEILMVVQFLFHLNSCSTFSKLIHITSIGFDHETRIYFNPYFSFVSTTRQETKLHNEVSYFHCFLTFNGQALPFTEPALGAHDHCYSIQLTNPYTSISDRFNANYFFYCIVMFLSGSLNV